jgi:hypothetical protein
MSSLFDALLARISAQWKPRTTPARGRSYRCTRCGRQVFFRNSKCLGCGSALGYVPALGQVKTLAPAGEREFDLLEGPGRYRRCANFELAAGCNWMIPIEQQAAHCAACRLNRTIPDLTDADNARYWAAIELAKRRLVSQLIALGLPVRSKIDEDPEHGLMFDFLRSPPEGPRVLTGHASGLITINVEEADDAKREKIKHDLREPYRTLLGHFRHEVGHYYWDRLVWSTPWLERFRELFGDERASYADALKRHYENGPPADWRDRHISSYAASHPWEDWAESWAHYLHISDSLDTALGFGLDADSLETEIEPFGRDDLYAPDHPSAKGALTMLNAWVELMMVLNELARSMGQQDLYPFVMSRPVVKKLHFIHMVVTSASQN